MKNPEIKTKKLIIRPLSDEELEELCKSVTDAEEKKAYGEMLEGCRSHHVNRLWYTAWEISLRDTGERVGDMCFKGTPENNETEIGYGIDEQHRNKGYASEAVKALTEWAFSNSGELYFVTAQADPENTASIRVLQKNGFVPAGRGDEGLLFEKERPTVSWMSIFLCIGVGVGLCFGSVFDNIAIGMCLGMCIGLALGSAIDSNDRKKRIQIKRERRKGQKPEGK